MSLLSRTSPSEAGRYVFTSTSCVRPSFQSLTFSRRRYTAGSRAKDGKDFFQACPEAVSRFTKEFKSFGKGCASTSPIHTRSIGTHKSGFIETSDIKDMRIVFPPTHSSLPSVAGVESSGASASMVDKTSDEPPASNRNSPSTETQSIPRMSKAKWKQPRARSPSDESDVDLDFDKLDKMPEEEHSDDEDDDSRFPPPIPSSPSSPSLTIIDRVGDDEFGSVRLETSKWMRSYEYSRLKKMAENKSLLRSLGIPEAAKAAVAGIPPPSNQQRARVPVINPGPPRNPLPRASKNGEKS